MKAEKVVMVIKPYKYENPTLDGVRQIYLGNTCIVAKNSKFGGLYLNKNAKIIKGKFHHTYGSNNYPILMPKSEVHIELQGFSGSEKIETDQYKKQDFIKLLNK